MSLHSEFETLLPPTDPLTGDLFQLITRPQYFTVMGPKHETSFYRMATRHTPQGLVLDIPYFVSQWWPEEADIAALIRWDPEGNFINMTAYLRMKQTEIRIVMSIGETSLSNTIRGVLWDLGARTLTQEARPKRLAVAQSRGWEIDPVQNRHGRHELTLRLTQRPLSALHIHPAGSDPGRR